MVAMAAEHQFPFVSATPTLFGLFFYSLISASRYALATTDASDVQPLQVMFSSLNSPSELISWRSSGGDPCSESWKGITCEGSAVVSIDISGLGLHGWMGYLLSDLLSLKKLDVSRNRIQGEIPYQLPPNLTSLNVAGNNLSGNLPYSFSNIVSLNYLALSFNKFSGDPPYAFSSSYLENNQLTGSLNILSTIPLTILNVANNHFSGWVPQELYSIPNFKYGGNSFEKGPAPPPPPYSTPPPGRPRSRAPPEDFDAESFQSERGLAIGAIIGIIAGTVVVSLILLAVFAICVCKNKRPKTVSRTSGRQLPAGVGLNYVTVVGEDQRIKSAAAVADRESTPAENLTVESLHGSFKGVKPSITATSYTIASLQTATNSFGQEHLVGEGSRGRVYRADFPNGKTMAIKKMEGAALSLREEDKFLQLVWSISRLRHPNIVTLVGYCAEQGQRLLVYEYFGNGRSLHDMLHYTEDGCKTLNWNSRVRVALGSARALEYLHEVCSPSIVHRNFKSANILVDEETNPHLSDCGLAALAPNAERQIRTQLVGSFGYSAPEYALSGVYTVKSDVYSFGVVMLELLTGRKPLDSWRTRSEQSLVRWATPQLDDVDALAKLVDPALNGIYPAKSLSRFADIIALCIKTEPELRPPMSEVVQALVGLVQRAKRRPSDESSFLWKSTDQEAMDSSF